MLFQKESLQVKVSRLLEKRVPAKINTTEGPYSLFYCRAYLV